MSLVPVRNPANGSIAHVSEQYAQALERHEPPWSRVDEADVPDEDTGVQLPARSASKTTWVDFAVAHGVDRSEAEAKTRDELADQYGA